MTNEVNLSHSYRNYLYKTENNKFCLTFKVQKTSESEIRKNISSFWRQTFVRIIYREIKYFVCLSTNKSFPLESKNYWQLNWLKLFSSRIRKSIDSLNTWKINNSIKWWDFALNLINDFVFRWKYIWTSKLFR